MYKVLSNLNVAFIKKEIVNKRLEEMLRSHHIIKYIGI